MSEKEIKHAMLDAVAAKIERIRKTYDKKVENLQQIREMAGPFNKTVADVIGGEIETVVSLLNLSAELCEALKEEMDRE